MQIIKEKQYEYLKENLTLARVQFTSNNTLSLITSEGTHYNFNRDELKMIIEFINKLNLDEKDFKMKCK